MKRVTALLLSAIFLLCLCLLPIPSSAEGADSTDPYAIRYPKASEIWRQIEALENERQAMRGKDLTESVYQLVQASDTTVAGSLDRHGDAFFWYTTDGEACGYLPALREKLRRGAIEPDKQIRNTEPIVIGSDSRGGMPSANNVAVFQPYYGLDTGFTKQYKKEGESIAAALGGVCTVYQTSAATIDQIASALENSAVVIFDSHGATDYESGDDCVSGAHTSYVCLYTGEGLTDEDKQIVIGEDNVRYTHALYAGTMNDIPLYCVDGTAIANHMSKKAPNNLLWMAICLGMTTDGLCKPLRQKGVQVVYGYTQQVSFRGDYRYEETFFGAIKKGATVKSAISYMKRTHGLWDPEIAVDSVAEAQEREAAFPIVVSGEDKYPGHGNVDREQTVKSKWKAKEPDFLYGDVDCSGTVNAADASRLLRSLVKLAGITTDGSLAADVNADGKLDAADAALILRRSVGLIASFAAEG